jgi:hypothetical protein
MLISHSVKQWIASAKRFEVIVALLVLAPMMMESGCGGSNPVTPPLALNEMQATSSGEGDFLSNNAVADSSNGTYNVIATMSISGGGSLTINVIVPKEASLPYQVDVASNQDALIGYCLNPTGSQCNEYEAGNGIGSGQITITQISPSLMGTFRGTLWQTPSSGTDTTRTISDGQFNAPFP